MTHSILFTTTDLINTLCENQATSIAYLNLMPNHANREKLVDALASNSSVRSLTVATTVDEFKILMEGLNNNKTLETLVITNDITDAIISDSLVRTIQNSNTIKNLVFTPLVHDKTIKNDVKVSYLWINREKYK